MAAPTPPPQAPPSAQADAVRARAAAAVAGFIDDGVARDALRQFDWKDRVGHPAVRQALADSREYQAAFVICCVQEAQRCLAAQGNPWARGDRFSDEMADRKSIATLPLSALIRRDLPFTIDDATTLAEARHKNIIRWVISAGAFIRVYERALRGQRPKGRLRELLLAWLNKFEVGYTEDRLALKARLRLIIDPSLADQPPEPPPINTRPPILAFKPAAAEMINAARAVGRALREDEPSPPARRIQPDAWTTAAPADLLALALSTIGALAGKHTNKKESVHFARLALPAPAFQSLRDRAPAFCEAAASLFIAIRKLPESDLMAAGIPITNGELGDRLQRYCILCETLQLSGGASPAFRAWFTRGFAAAQRCTDVPEWGRHFEALQAEHAGPPPTVVYPGDAWTDAAISHINKSKPATRAAWLALLAHARSAPAKPTTSWLAASAPLARAVGRSCTPTLLRWLARIGKPGSRARSIYGWPADRTCLMDANTPVLRGLLFAAAHSCTPALAPSLAAALADTAATCDRKTLHMGPRCAVVRNAAVTALTLLPADIGGPQIARINELLKYKAARTQGRRALSAAAAGADLSPEEFAERHIPTYGLLNGEVHISAGPTPATIRINGSVVAVHRPGPQPAPPPTKPAKAQSPRKQPAEPDTADRLAGEIRSMLAAQILRLERLLGSDRSWPLDQWQSLYLDHPLLSHLASRLIWSIQTGARTRAAMRLDNLWTDSRGRAIGDLPAGAVIRAWHPARARTAEVHAWRRLLETRRIRQPFKQAHREVYLLTPAEEQARDRSARFASHILRAGQLLALMHERRWEGNPAIAFDTASSPPTLPLPEHDLVATLGAEPLDDDPEGGRFPLLVSQELRFTRPGRPAPVPLTDIPPLVLSEVMRDIDLFISVCSIGTDPEWELRGHTVADGYWRQYAFGELHPTAQTRRDLLERLLPRLSRLAPVASLDRQFLIIRGTRRTYKIHLGSANVMMEPNDQYLCIVPASATDPDEVSAFLPFEGDRTLSIILSKALMLAADDTITDSDILSQIRRR